EVGLVGRAGDEPLLAVQDVVAGRGVTLGGGGQPAGVGARVRLGDGVASEALAAHAWLEVATTLIGVGVDQGVVGAGDERPEPARRLAKLLVDDHLVDGAPRLAAKLARERSAVQSRVDRRALQLISGRRREPPTGSLELGFEGLEVVDDVGARPRLQVELIGREAEVHGPRMTRRPAASAKPPGSRDAPEALGQGRWARPRP